MKQLKSAGFLLGALAALWIAGCGGPLDATIGGTVNGLSGGTTVGLLDNGGDALSVGANGSFAFAKQVEAGSTYNVTVATQPIGEICAVVNGAGTVSQNVGNVTTITVNCNAVVTAGNYVFGTVAGLATGASVTLLDNGADSLAINANGPFVFKTPLSAGTVYSVTVSLNPSGQICTVPNGNGVIPLTGTAPTVTVTCN